ncbi:hypothetical protein [Natronohydrobacter thiooxidans]|uniref:hypothetical protein n=1 Tax=Natronohydrobacter thiooxidans TaxID=87172 RepID=UPI0008FF7612|nr:hypothetical protein [Natronohydrobacter thiooxidans]
MGKAIGNVPAMKIASAMAKRRGWDHDVMSTHQMFLVLPSEQTSRGYYAEFMFAPDYSACTITLRLHNELIAERIGEVQKVIESTNKVAVPARFSLIDEYGHFLLYQVEIVFSETGVSADLLEAKANEAVSRFDCCALAVMLANLGDKSAEEALACVEDKLGRNC